MSAVSAALRLGLFVVWTLALLLPYLIALAVGVGYRPIGALYWFGVVRWVMLAKVVVHGDVTHTRPLILVGNHSTYVDIAVMGSLIHGSFVAKAEVRSWPGLGFLAVIARTVFVDRKRSAVTQHRDQIANRLADGEPLILFPEGTTSNGNKVLPFKSALFNVAEHASPENPLHIQPFAIAYTRAGGLPMGLAQRPFYAWVGDEELLPHLWELLCRGSFTVEVAFLPAVSHEDFLSRKALASFCEAEVRRGLIGLLTGTERQRTQLPPLPLGRMPVDPLR